MSAHNGPFIEMVADILQSLEEILALTAVKAEDKPCSPEPDTALLQELAEACKRYKASVMDEILCRLEAYHYESGGDLIVWLREQLDNLEYDAIRERLEWKQ